MDHILLLGVLFLAISDCLVNCDNRKESRRTWKTNINYNNSHNWNLGRLPCDADRIVLQKTESVVLELPEGKNFLRELVLPTYTELLLPRNGLVQFTGLKKSSSCDGDDVIFKPVQPSRWLDPENWDGWNQATPDFERVPCVLDAVRFPPESTYKIIIPDYIRVGSLEINGQSVDALNFFNEDRYGVNAFQTPEGHRPNHLLLTRYTCDATEWCECGNEYLRSQICFQEPCHVPLCQHPVQPYGFCCPLCGAYILLDLKSIKKEQLTDDLNFFLNPKGVLWHASQVGESIQVVLVEGEEYTGELTDVAESLKTYLDRRGHGWTAKEFHVSGYALYPMTFGQVVGQFFSFMVVSALILASIIVYYSRSWSWVSISPLEGRPFVFARFENQSGEVIVASEEREPPNTLKPQTFDNPMYNVTNQDQGAMAIETPIYTELEESPKKESVDEFTNLIE